jgi:2-keto-4-pentenoate hydratase/2-oxohepta-3-ene-1,7-dioic acid hydratase in catechol pathway
MTRLITVPTERGTLIGLVREGRFVVLPGEDPDFASMAALIAAGSSAVENAEGFADSEPDRAWLPTASTTIGPAVPDPGAIYTVGLNYDGPGAAPRPERPLIYGKAASSVGGHGATLAWDRSVTDDVDAEIELGVVMGANGSVFGYTCVNDISARDERLDGDQWLLGKSMPGFCPVGPWIITADDFDPTDVRLTATIDGEPIQDGRTSQMRYDIPAIIAYLGRHLELRPGDLIATGTPVRLATPPGPGRRLRAGDTVTVAVEGIGELTTHIA